MSIKRIGILTGGGYCPGLNPVIRAVVKTATLKYGIEVMGIKNGYKGMYNGDIMPLSFDSVSNILRVGGTILYSSNKDNLFEYPFEENGVTVYKDVSDVGIENLKKFGIDGLIIVGGDGTLTSARDFARKGVKVVGVPKTIDNDLASTDTTFGFDTAVSIATESMDRLQTTAESHHRLIVCEVMGRYSGWIALNSGIAAGADIILIPEIPYDINKVAQHIKDRIDRGKTYSIICVAEGSKSITGEMVIMKIIENSPDPIRLGGIGNKLAADLEEMVGLESRATVLGHVQRGGTPSSFDRILSTRYGVAAVEFLMEGRYGDMVTLKGTEMCSDSLENIIGNNKNVESDGELVKAAKAIGISFGD